MDKGLKHLAEIIKAQMESIWRVCREQEPQEAWEQELVAFAGADIGRESKQFGVGGF